MKKELTHLIDAGTWRPLDETVSPCDPLEFSDQKPYIERLKESQATNWSSRCSSNWYRYA